jgi:bifunctional oligoribonuclease and PAP phosphatase NrnA
MTADHSATALSTKLTPALDFSRILPAARSLIAASTRVLVITHVNPDGDAVGSALGVGLALRMLGKEVVFACADPVPETFDFLPALGEFTNAPQGEFDLIVVADVSDAARMGAIGQRLSHRPNLLFDHHITNPGFAEINFIDVSAASTAELITDLLEPLGLPLTQPIAAALLTGVVNDTLGFRTSNTTPRSLALAQKLMEAGAPLHTIYDRSLFKRSFAATRLWAEGLATLHLSDGIVWAELSLAARKAAGYFGMGDADLINVLMSVREAQVAIIFVERPDGTIKISWRSGTNFSVAPLASSFGGGGHPAAAGAEIPGALPEVEEKVLTATKALMKVKRDT